MSTIIGIGELLWDVFEDGRVLGGAPANFTYHVHCLGDTGLLLSRVGSDELGDEILAAFDTIGLCTEFIQRDADHPTGEVNVKLDAEGKPDFTIVKDVAWDYMQPDRKWIDAAGDAKAICFGTLAQRSPQSRSAVLDVLDAAGKAVRVFDVNLRQDFYSRKIVEASLKRTTILKLNPEELREMKHLLRSRHKDEKFIRQLMDRFSIKLTCVTRGAEGCSLYTQEESISRPVPETEVTDTVGAGDAFTAGLVVKYLRHRPLRSIADAANLLGSQVAGRRGAMPEMPREVLKEFDAL